MSALVSASTAERYALDAAIRTSTGNFIHRIWRSAGSINGQTNCGLKPGRSSRRALVKLSEVQIDRLCVKCWPVEHMKESQS